MAKELFTQMEKLEQHSNDMDMLLIPCTEHSSEETKIHLHEKYYVNLIWSMIYYTTEVKISTLCKIDSMI